MMTVITVIVTNNAADYTTNKTYNHRCPPDVVAAVSEGAEDRGQHLEEREEPHRLGLVHYQATPLVQRSVHLRRETGKGEGKNK